MTLNKILALDALTCALMGIALIFLATALSGLLALPQDLLFHAGWLLLPIALFMALLARQSRPSAAGTWLVILGNLAWVVASLTVLLIADPNALGVGFVVIQAIVVAGLARAEFGALPRHTAGLT